MTSVLLRFVVEGEAINLTVDAHAPLLEAGRRAVEVQPATLPHNDNDDDGPIPVPARDVVDDWYLHTLTGAKLDARRSAASYGLDAGTTILVVRALGAKP